MSLKTDLGSSAVELPLTIEEGDGEIRKSMDAPGSPRPMRYSSLSLEDVVCLCADLRDCTINHEDQEILGYIKKTARSVTSDYLRGQRSQKRGCDKPHISLSEVDLEAGKQADGSQERIVFAVLEREIDELLTDFLTGPDQERDRIIFLLYIRQRMSTKEIASLSTIGLTAKGVGSVIERLKRCLREQIIRSRADSENDEG